MSDTKKDLKAIAIENLAQTVERLAREATCAVSESGFPFVVKPADFVVVPLEHVLRCPERIRQRVDLQDVPSFIAYVNRFKEPSTLLYAAEASLSCFAILDHSAPGAPSWGSHQAALTLQPTREWQAWLAMNGRQVGQLDFAQFLEDNLPDIAAPKGADVLDMARQLDVKKGVAFASSVRLDNGQTQLTYTEDIHGSAAKGTLALLDAFTLGLAPFDGAPLYKVTARLRYRLQETKLVLWFDLLRPQDVVRQAWRDLLGQMATETGLTVPAHMTAGQSLHPLAK